MRNIVIPACEGMTAPGTACDLLRGSNKTGTGTLLRHFCELFSESYGSQSRFC